MDNEPSVLLYLPTQTRLETHREEVMSRLFDYRATIDLELKGHRIKKIFITLITSFPTLPQSLIFFSNALDFISR